MKGNFRVIFLCCTLPLIHSSVHWLSATLSRPFKEIIVCSNIIIFFDITAKWKKKLMQLFSHWKMLFHQTGLDVLDLFIFSLKILKFAGFTLL